MILFVALKCYSVAGSLLITRLTYNNCTYVCIFTQGKIKTFHMGFHMIKGQNSYNCDFLGMITSSVFLMWESYNHGKFVYVFHIRFLHLSPCVSQCYPTKFTA